MKKKTKPSATSDDQATRYAQAVTDGTILAGPHVRDACRRHLNDLQNGAARGLRFDTETASRAIGFFTDVLRLNGGEYEGKPYDLLDWQAFIIGCLFGWMGNDGYRRYRMAYVETAKGPLALDTPILTPAGWTTMGEISPGDYVFDDSGKPTSVIEVSPVFTGRSCFKLSFSDGATIIADADHRWKTAALRIGLKPGPRNDGVRKGGYAKRTTKQIADTLRVHHWERKHIQAKWNHRVDVAPALQTADVDLPFPPYVLGVWLGDGDSDCGRLTVSYADWQIVDEIVASGVEVSEKKRHCETTARVLLGDGNRTQEGRNNSPQATLRGLNVLGNKHIPEKYLKAGTAQRLALLQGLMDSDGTVAFTGKCELSVCNRRLAEDALELMRGLGFKVTLRENRAKLYGKVIGLRYRLGFQAYRDFPVFRLARKRARLGEAPQTRPLCRGRMIVGVEPTESVPVRCITVAAASSMFLAGKHLVPTCNSGKSPLAAGIGLYGMMADGEDGAEIYAAATKKDQAMILFRDAVAMVDLSPELSAMVTKSGTGLNVWNLAWVAQRRFFRPLSSDDGQSGPRPHIVLLDEIHEHKDDYVIRMLKAGQKSRRQPLMFGITNSGTDKRSVCWDYHDYGAKVCAGQIEDDSFFAYICALDETDDPFKDENCWEKVNPSLRHGLPGLRYLREQVTQARGMPSMESMVRRLNFCQWVESSAPWISGDVWFHAEDKFPPSLLLGRRCWGGLDLSSTQDLTALVLVFEPTEVDPVWRQAEWFWLPADGLHEKAERDRVPYLAWRSAGHLLTTEGRAVNKLAVVRQAAEIAALYDLQVIGFDRWRIEDVIMICGQEGISLPLVPFGQGYKDMAPAVDEYERRLVGGQIKHSGNPVMTWNAANAVLTTDPAGNRKVTKEKATGRVDGIVAAVMATGSSMTRQEERSVYEDRGLIFI